MKNPATLSIELFRGQRAELLPLFQQADDSALHIASYIELGEVLVAREEPRLVGHAQLIAMTSAEWELKSVAVIAARQGRGIGRALVRAALLRAFEAAAVRVQVSTASADIDNLRFYQRLGFRLERVERDVFTVERGYPAGLESDGIPVRDRVWLSTTRW